MRVGMIKAKHLESLSASRSTGVEMFFRIYDKAGRTLIDVSGANPAGNLFTPANQHTATLKGLALTRMGHHIVQHTLGNYHRVSGVFAVYNASTTIAVPIPPPMHSDATP